MFCCEYCKILRTPILKKICERLLIFVLGQFSESLRTFYVEDSKLSLLIFLFSKRLKGSKQPHELLLREITNWVVQKKLKHGSNVRLKPVNYFRKKVPSQVFLSTVPRYKHVLQYISRVLSREKLIMCRGCLL